MSLSIYKIVVLKSFLRKIAHIGECTICYETERLFALHDDDYRHGVCMSCKQNYKASSCHVCRAKLSNFGFNTLSIVTDSENLLDFIMDLSDDSSTVDLIRQDIINIVSGGVFTRNQFIGVLRRIRTKIQEVNDRSLSVYGEYTVVDLDYLINSDFNGHCTNIENFIQILQSPVARA